MSWFVKKSYRYVPTDVVSRTLVQTVNSGEDYHFRSQTLPAVQLLQGDAWATGAPDKQPPCREIELVLRHLKHRQ